MSVHVEFAGFCLMLAVMAVVLSFASISILRLLNKLADFKNAQKLRSSGVVAAEKSRVSARSAKA